MQKCTKPSIFIHTLSCFQANKTNKVASYQIEAFLAKNAKLEKAKASEALAKLIKDDLLIPDKSNGTLRIVGEAEIKTYNQDLYCFECFLPGELVKCLKCTRAFHVSCWRRSPDRPNYIIPPSNQVSKYSDEHILSKRKKLSSNPSPETTAESTLMQTPRIKQCRVLIQRSPLISSALKRSENSNADAEDKEESKPEIDDKNNIEIEEVVFCGELRPPTRQRHTTESSSSMKFETDNQTEQMNLEKKYCTCCRLYEVGKILQPPNLEADELCHLLKYTFNRNRAWMKQDILKIFDGMKFSKKTVSIILKIFFQNRPLTTLETIEEKIRYNQYKLLNELLIDVLEFQYALGILFGSESLNFDKSKFLVREIQYDISEIRRCPDCFRHSNDRIVPFWFALPCIQRHELVFAKCSGHPYWPAKVVRVLKNADKYDVRFFGGNHKRAVIDKKLVRPIDADIVKPKTVAFKKSMNELQCYQALEAYSSDKFSFHSANALEINEIIKTVLNAIDFKMSDSQRITKRRKTVHVTDNRRVSYVPSSNYEENSSNFAESNIDLQSLNGTPIPLGNHTMVSIPRVHPLNTANTPPISSSHNNSEVTLEQYLALQRQCDLLKHELIIAKRKSYCFKCLKPAKLLCCINASYCSKQCQQEHWTEQHHETCTHGKGNRNC